MTDANLLGKAIDSIVVLNAAFTNIRLYPPTSAMIGKSIENAEQSSTASSRRKTP